MTGWWFRLRVIALILGGAAIWLVALDRRLTREASQSLESSDAAFNDGRLRDALQGAYRASLAWTLGSPLDEQAAARMRAVAVGSEATGRKRSALLSWSALAVRAFDGAPSSGSRVVAGEAVQHLRTLLPKKPDVRESDVPTYGRVGASLAAVRPSSLAPRTLFSFVSLGLFGFVVLCTCRASPKTTARVPLSRLVAWSINLTAGLCWCIGWLLL